MHFAQIFKDLLGVWGWEQLHQQNSGRGEEEWPKPFYTSSATAGSAQWTAHENRPYSISEGRWHQLLFQDLGWILSSQSSFSTAVFDSTRMSMLFCFNFSHQKSFGSFFSGPTSNEIFALEIQMKSGQGNVLLKLLLLYRMGLNLSYSWMAFRHSLVLHLKNQARNQTN